MKLDAATREEHCVHLLRPRIYDGHVTPAALTVTESTTLKEIIIETDLYLVNLSSKIYVFEDKITKY